MSDRTTPIVCEACGGAPVKRESCRHCDRSGQMTREQVLRYRTDREARLTGQYASFYSVALDVVRLLEKRKNPTAKILAEEGKQVLERLARANEMSSGNPERTEAIKSLMDYQRRALAFLAGNR